VEVKIGMQSVPRELVVETSLTAEELEQSLADALADGGHSVFALPVSKGGKVLVPATSAEPGDPSDHTDGLLVHLVTTSRWNDVTNGRVIPAAAVDAGSMCLTSRVNSGGTKHSNGSSKQQCS
jgi:hypothetical protein